MTSIRKPSTPAVDPPVHHRVDGLPDLRVLPVQVGLLAREQVQVVLPAALVELPGRAGERRLPVGRLGTLAAGLEARRGPGATSTSPASAEAGSRDSTNHGCSSEVWLTTRSITSLMPRSCSAGDQRVEIVQRAEQRVDVLVVADVVAVVVHRRAVDRRQPDHVDAELGQVVQARR